MVFSNSSSILQTSYKYFPNWQCVWMSKAYGAIAYDKFGEKLEELTAMEENHTFTQKRFAILSKLKNWAQANNGYTEWREWAREKLISEGITPPRDPVTMVQVIKKEEAHGGIEDDGYSGSDEL